MSLDNTFSGVLLTENFLKVLTLMMLFMLTRVPNRGK